MQIRRFQAPTMVEAVQKVKAELGPDALVLSTKKVRGDPRVFGLFSRPLIEITASADRERRREAEHGRTEAEPTPDAQEAAATPAISESLLVPLEAELRELRKQVAGMALASAESRSLREEMAELHGLVEDLALRGATPRAGWDATSAGLSLGRSRSLEDRVSALLAEGACTSRNDARERVLIEALDRRLAVSRPDEPPRVEVFVGSPGVGKTTTLAKLAAREERTAGGISLVTTDTYRIGAEEQLRTYASLLQVPFQTATSSQEVEALARREAGKRIYVDTAGRSCRETAALSELVALRDVLAERGRVHLVVSATTRAASLRAQLRHYAALRPDSLVVTKVDEAGGLGDCADLVLDDALPPLLWIADGQRVPEDLRVPEPRPLARQILEAA